MINEMGSGRTRAADSAAIRGQRPGELWTALHNPRQRERIERARPLGGCGIATRFAAPRSEREGIDAGACAPR